MIEQLLNCLTMVSQSVQVNILNNSCLYGTVLRKIYCLYISHVSPSNNDRRAAKLSWSVQVNILNKHYVDNISCLYGTVHGTQNILSVHIICFPPPTMIEQLLNCPTMASWSQQGFVQVNIPNELNFIHVTLHFTFLLALQNCVIFAFL